MPSDATAIDPVMRYEKRYIDVLGKRMAYVECGHGDPIVFLHGNVTSSYMWRNIIPYLEPHARCIAIDNIGQGDSDKLDPSGPDSYRLDEHQRYIDAALEALGIGTGPDADSAANVTFMMHDWGSQLGFTWARNHPGAIRGLAYCQALVGDFSWGHWPEEVQALFQRFRSDEGEELVLEHNHFVEKVLPAMILRDLDEATWNEYRRPYATPGEGRRPTLTWPRDIPIDGEPADVLAVMEENDAWLQRTNFPKLFINTEPGAVLIGRHRDICRAWPNQTEVTVRGLHYVHEDSPDDMGKHLADWYRATA